MHKPHFLPRRRGSYRPWLEALEDRLAPGRIIDGPLPENDPLGPDIIFGNALPATDDPVTLFDADREGFQSAISSPEPPGTDNNPPARDPVPSGPIITGLTGFGSDVIAIWTQTTPYGFAIFTATRIDIHHLRVSSLGSGGSENLSAEMTSFGREEDCDVNPSDPELGTRRFELVNGLADIDSPELGILTDVPIDPLWVDLDPFRGENSQVLLPQELILRPQGPGVPSQITYRIAAGLSYLTDDQGPWQINATVIMDDQVLDSLGLLRSETSANGTASSFGGNSRTLTLVFNNVIFVRGDVELPGRAHFGCDGTANGMIR